MYVVCMHYVWNPDAGVAGLLELLARKKAPRKTRKGKSRELAGLTATATAAGLVERPNQDGASRHYYSQGYLPTSLSGGSSGSSSEHRG